MGILGRLKALVAPGRSILPGAQVEVAAVGLTALPTGQLQQRHAAGLALQTAVEALAAEGRTVLDVVLDGKPFAKWEMYPGQGGILDQRSNSQYFYHSHADYRGEHGHFHAFYYHQRRLAHLIAIGVDERGRINRLYTFNRWGPGDHYFPARTLKGFLPRFRIGPRPDPEQRLDGRLHAFVNHALGLFRAEIEHLIDAREETFARYRATHNGAEPYEDRALEITSALPVDVPTQMARLAAELARRGAVVERAAGPAAASAPHTAVESGEDGVADAPVQAPALAARPMAQVRHAHEAGLALRTLAARLRGQGRTVVQAVMHGEDYAHWAMYPWDGGVEDRKTRSQYFYHAHPQSPEHGHFHLFCRHRSQLVHVVALAMDNQGEPVSLFTVNRWVTGDFFLPAAKLAGYVTRFRMDTDAFERDVGDYLRHALALYQAEIAALLHARDALFARYRAGHDGAAPFEDREVEVTSTLPIDVEGQIAALEAELRRRGAL